MKNHFFLAIPLPGSWKEEFSFYIQKINSKFPFARWVHPDDLHITLAFLGSVDEDQKEKLKVLLRKVAKEHATFPLSFSELGTFGNQHSPRIFWYGTEESYALHELRKDVYQACEKVGFQLDTRPFHPHITLARKWVGPGSISRDTLPEYSTIKNTFNVRSIILYETHINKIPKYEAKAEFPLIGE
ncbi:RNA 2',3'-cyclic phosphodiesterase [Sutcliffiella rhizosphaerae]|uniref:RNA 2',3'-cyclic phosphodiesterase n=1 Tax=Sutcliffiella rhizosphaerae TaxID=2880967 RepID=A0ABM8YQG9_9BACI|nr:RNA 2',3'-cyclic phosphodiesterase [Sutcliffiella rhizosphaerae]CAG9622144.1 RNA 2',3'-cyclic phosphodiesterase [Sutcliffiella rhizosphaerae]